MGSFEIMSKLGEIKLDQKNFTELEASMLILLLSEWREKSRLNVLRVQFFNIVPEI